MVWNSFLVYSWNRKVESTANSITYYMRMAGHYICTGGCRGISDTPGVCQTEGCPKYGQPLEECGCENGKHYGKWEEEAEKNDMESENKE